MWGWDSVGFSCCLCKRNGKFISNTTACVRQQTTATRAGSCRNTSRFPPPNASYSSQHVKK